MLNQKIASPAAWLADDLGKNAQRCYTLNPEELDILKRQALSFIGKDVEKITINDVDLGQLGEKIKHDFRQRLENGLGTLLLDGIRPEQFNGEEIMGKVLWIIGLYFGSAVSQSPAGEQLHSVEDRGYDVSHPKSRGTHTNVALPFHHDLCDVPALMCIRQAKQGGESRITSLVAIHNYMLENYPDLLQELYAPFYFAPHPINTTFKALYFKHPIFSFEQGHFVCHHFRNLINSAQHIKDVPRLTDKQIKALDVLDELIQSPMFCYQFYLKPGQIWFMNNFTTMHSRTAFEDFDDKAKHRLLLRLWLSVPNRPLPQSYAIRYHKVNAGELRGGILPEEQAE
ncbi:MAG: TauD/TfdA family dioxygenase [Pseudomonadota bacterium]